MGPRIGSSVGIFELTSKKNLPRIRHCTYWKDILSFSQRLATSHCVVSSHYLDPLLMKHNEDKNESGLLNYLSGRPTFTPKKKRVVLPTFGHSKVGR